MKILATIEFDFGNIDARMHELIKESVKEQMEIADVYFTVARPKEDEEKEKEPLELSPIRIEVIAATIGR